MIGIAQVLAGGILFTLFFTMLSPMKREREQLDYENLHINNLKILIKSAKKKINREFQALKAGTAKLMQLNESTVSSITMGMPAARQQHLMIEFSAVVAAIKVMQAKAEKCVAAIDTRYEPAKRAMRDASSKSGVDTAFTSTQALLKKDIDCVKTAIASAAELEDKFHKRWGNILR